MWQRAPVILQGYLPFRAISTVESGDSFKLLHHKKSYQDMRAKDAEAGLSGHSPAYPRRRVQAISTFPYTMRPSSRQMRCTDCFPGLHRADLFAFEATAAADSGVCHRLKTLLNMRRRSSGYQRDSAWPGNLHTVYSDILSQRSKHPDICSAEVKMK